MNIIQKYHLDDFTHRHYVKLIRLAKKKYKFRGYTNFKKNENFVIWRHDVDASMAHANVIAGLEAKEKISATYFILLHSEMYNLLEKTESDCVKSIKKLGHDIGLHFDSSYYEINSERDLVKYLSAEKEFLEKVFKIKISSFAFHNPTPECLKYDKWKYAGMINTYSDYFRKNVGYCSDSNGHWRYKRLEDELKNGGYKTMHVLTHPVFWQKQTGYPKHKIWGSIFERANTTIDWYNSILKSFGRDNIGEHNRIFDYLKSLDRKTGLDLEKKWIQSEYETAYLLLWKFHQKTVNAFLRKYIEIELLKSRRNVDYFYNNAIKLDLYKRFELVTGLSFMKTFGIKYTEYKTLISIPDSILNANNKYSTAAVKKGFVSLANFLIKLETIIRN